MANRRKKRRGKRREPQQQLPRPSRGREQPLRPDAVLPTAAQAERAVASPALDDSHTGGSADRTIVGTILEVEREFIWIETEGARAKLYASELMLDIGEVPADRYAPGDHFEAFVFQMGPDPESGAPQFSIRRAAPYLDALNHFEVGSVVESAIVVNTYNVGIELDVGGMRGNAFFWEIPLAHDESSRDRYQPGETIDDLFVWRVDRNARHLDLSVRRNAPSYVEALNAYSVGDVVSAAVADFWSNGGLWFNVGGVLGAMLPWELSLSGDEPSQEHYAVGYAVDDLFVWQVDRDARDLALSVRRNAPGYIKALNAHSVGDVVSAIVIDFQDNGGLWLDVGGLIGSVPPWDLLLADDESPQDHYTVGATVDNLLVWQVNHGSRDIFLSIRRGMAGYVEALADISVSDPLDGIVTEVYEEGLWLDVASVVGWIPAREMQLDEGQSRPTRYSAGESVRARVWQIDQTSRTIILSVRRLGPDFPEEQIEIGAPIDAVIRGSTGHGLRSPIRVLAANSEVWIPPHALALTVGALSQFKDGEVIRPIVTEVDGAGRPTRLSLRRALDGWDTAVERLSALDFLIPNARIVPYDAVTEAELRDGAAAVDLGPILGLISQEETDAAAGKMLMKQSANLEYGVVVESVDRERGTASVSHDRFEARWREVAEQLELKQGGEFEGELRDFDRVTALFDLGSGLLAQMPARELPDSEPPGKAEIDRIGDRFSLRITSVDHDKQIVHVEPRNQWLEALIDEPESETLEFKEVLRGSDKNERRGMTHEAMRTITGFLNTSGGNLVIGIDDNGKVVGLEIDDGLTGTTMVKKIDSANKTLQDNMKNVMPLNPPNVHGDLRDLVTWATPLVRGRTLLVVTCQRGPDDGVWLLGRRQPEFWIRQGQETTQLDVQKDKNAISAHLRDRRQRNAASDKANSDD